MMKSGTRTRILLSLGAAAALGLAASTLAQMTKSTPAPTPTPTALPDAQVSVTLSRDASGAVVGINAPTPDPVFVSAGGRQQARWTLTSTDDDEIGIEVLSLPSDPPPFASQPGHPGSAKKDVVSGPANPNAANRSYQYRIIVKRPDGTALKLDPIIKVTP